MKVFIYNQNCDVWRKTEQRIKTRKIIMELHKRNNSCTRLSSKSGKFNRNTVIGLYAGRLYQRPPNSPNWLSFEMRRGKNLSVITEDVLLK